MRILQVHNVQAAHGGVDEVIRLERSALSRRGHQVAFVGVETSEVLRRHGRLGAATRAVTNPDAVRLIGETMADFEPDVVHYHTPFPVMSLAALKVARSRGVASVATCHSFRYSCIAGTLRRQGADCELCVGRRVKTAGVLRRCYHDSFVGSLALTAGLAVHRWGAGWPETVDRFLVMTDFAAHILSQEGVDSGRLVVKANFVEDLGFRATPFGSTGADAHFNFLYAGRLEPEKGIRTLLEAWSARRVPSGGRLIIAGDGSLRREVSSAAAGDSTVTYRGFLDRERLSAALHEADCVVFPSEWPEAGPTLAMMEAFSVGAPVLAADVANFSDVIDEGVNGWTFGVGDPGHLADQLAAVASQDELSLGVVRIGARETYEKHFSEDVVVPKLLAVYQAAQAGLS